MKKFIITVIALLGIATLQQVTAQKTETIKLEQTTGEFDIKSLELEAGVTYQFQVKNNGVDHEVGFVIAPAGSTEMSDHVKEAYLKETLADGEKSKSGEVTLEAGEYVYFCPMNPTPEYTITVK